MSSISTSVALSIAVALGGCGALPDHPPPALPGQAIIILVPPEQMPAACGHPHSLWVKACTRMDRPGRPIILPLPQDYAGEQYARLVQFELAHAQQDWPDPAEIRDQLIRDAMLGRRKP